jgi:catechol 2,3-dioxygenase-like lactoylglutathione lyase family enzyme
MIETYGLTHIGLSVRVPEQSLKFYSQVFGVREYFRDDNQIQAQGPGPHDVLAFERAPQSSGKSRGHQPFWISA